MDGPRSKAPRPAAPRAEGGERIFEADDLDVSESEELERVVAGAAEMLQNGDVLSARARLERVLRHQPRDERARSLLGLSLFKLGELEKAQTIYRGLIEDNPADPTLRVNLGLVFLKAGASTEAIHCFETALDLGPEHPKAMNYLGLALAQQGQHERAREWFLRCGNEAMAERMAQALQPAELREVAEDAEHAIEGERPFSSALEDDSGAAPADEPPADDAPPADGRSTSLPPPPSTSRWVASTPAEGRSGRGQPRIGFAQPSAGPLEAPELELPGPLPMTAPSLSPSDASVPVAAATALADYTDQKRLSIPAGEGGFLIGATEVLIQVRGEMLTRLDGMVASFGSAGMRPELKRFRGKATDKPFGEGSRRMLRAMGEGRFVIARENRFFTALELDDEPAFFREEVLFAFEESLVFENGRVPAKAGPDLHLVHLRGRGRLLLVTAGAPRSVEVTRGEPLRIPMDQLVGWHGPLLQPRLVPIVEEAPDLGTALELAGEGRALVDAPDGR